MNATITSAQFNFDGMGDIVLRDLHATFAAGAERDGDDAEICRAGAEAAYTEMHRRALGIKVREITLTSTGHNHAGVRVIDAWTNCDRHVGTAREFMEAFDLRTGNRPHARQGAAQSTGHYGEIVRMEWFVA